MRFLGGQETRYRSAFNQALQIDKSTLAVPYTQKDQAIARVFLFTPSGDLVKQTATTNTPIDLYRGRRHMTIQYNISRGPEIIVTKNLLRSVHPLQPETLTSRTRDAKQELVFSPIPNQWTELPYNPDGTGKPMQTAIGGKEGKDLLLIDTKMAQGKLAGTITRYIAAEKDGTPVWKMIEQIALSPDFAYQPSSLGSRRQQQIERMGFVGSNNRLFVYIPR